MDKEVVYHIYFNDIYQVYLKSLSLEMLSFRLVMCSAAKLCLTFCDPMHCNPPSSSLYGIFQTRILE